MGLTYSKPKHLSYNEIESIVNMGNSQIEDYFNKIKHREYGVITFELFQLITCLKPEIAKAIFTLTTSNDKMYLSDLKYFYALLASPCVEHKGLFLSLLLFESQNDINEELYINNCLMFCYHCPYFSALTNSKFVLSIKSYPRMVNRVEFLKKFPYDLFGTFTFLKKEVDTLSSKVPIDNSLSYYCRCFHLKIIENTKVSQCWIEYEQMKENFQNIEKANGGIFPLSKFDKMMTEIKVHPLLVKAIGNYLKRKMMNSFIYFESFRNFILQFTQNEKEKVELLFDLLSYPNQFIQISDYLEYLPKLNIQIEKITKSEFIKLYYEQEESSFKEFVNSMNTINAIPYIYFNLIPKDFTDKIIYLEIAMKGMSFDSYLQENIIKEEEFYCIDGVFVQQIKDYLSNNNSSPSVLTMKHQPVIDIHSMLGENNMLKRNAVYRNDFFVCTKHIYSLISKWFRQSGTTLKFKKIVYEPELLSKITIDQYYPISCNNLFQVNEGLVHEIELYPVYIRFCSLEALYQKNKDMTINKLLSLLNEIANGAYLSETRGAKYSRKQRIGDFKKIVRLGGKDDTILNILIYYNNKLYHPDSNNDFEDEKIVDWCLMLLDPKQGNTFYYDILNQSDNPLQTSASPSSIQQRQNTKGKLLIEEDNSIASKETNETIKDSINEAKTNINDKDKDSKKTNDNICSPLGIGNIGNSCYLSSVLQIVINLPILRDILLLPQIPLLINQNSKYSHNGLIVYELINLLKKRWASDDNKDVKIINPTKLKIVSGKVHPQFNNAEQQDANEFLTFLLDECNEEINLKSEKIYLPNPEQGNKTQEELSNIYWANAMRRSASFINSLFLFQLKSKLICCKCYYEKISFETSSNLFLPIPLNPTIQLKILLFRLPYEYKAYYHKIHPPFEEYINNLSKNGTESSKPLPEIMKEYYINAIEKEELFISSIPIKFEIDIERTCSVEELIKRIRKIDYLKLEPNNRFRREDNDDIAIDEIQEDTYFAISTSSSTFINHKLKIDACFQDSQTLNIYELLNSNGLRKLTRQVNVDYSSPLVRLHNVKCSLKKYESFYQQTKQHKDTINSVNNWIAYYSQDYYCKDNIRLHKQTEYILPIHHCFQVKGTSYLFYKSAYSTIQFPEDYFIVNNSNQNTTARFIYDYIWARYKRFMKDPNKIQSKLWWKSIDDDYRICYPFHIKWVKQYTKQKRLYICSQCPYYSFCPGCIIDPFSKDNLFFDSESVILIVWCSLIYENELMQNSMNYCILKSDFMETQRQNENEKSLDDCINLFVEKENLDEQLKCDQCKTHQHFTKNFLIDKVPYVLVISLNRFKYATLYNKKISTLVKFPLVNFKLNEEIYDLYGVINHFGSMNSGHYTSIIKLNRKWVYFDDAKYCELAENKVMSKDAYILVYISKKDINDWDYYKMMISIINQIDKKKEGEEYHNFYEPEWTMGQPVMTCYGEGYYVGAKDDKIQVYINESGVLSFK